MTRTPPPPKGTGPNGRKLWTDVLSRYELEEHELALLREATRTIDQLDALHAIVEAEGLVVTGHGSTKAHPALRSADQLKITLARLLAALRLPAGDEDEPAQTRRPQRRFGARGVRNIGA